jgi:hypothetical protein
MCLSGYRRGLDWILVLLTTYILTIRDTDHWHIHISVLNLLHSPLAVSWQRIFNTGTVRVSLNYTFQISHIKSSLHNQTFNWELLLTILLSKSKSKSLYDWRFTANQFVLASSPLRLTTRDFFQLNPCSHSPYITSPLTRRRLCSCPKPSRL